MPHSDDLSDKSAMCIDASFRSKIDDPLLISHERVRKWLQESQELKLPVVISGTGSFRSRRGPSHVDFLSEEEAEMYPNKKIHTRLISSYGCFGIFSCLPLKTKR
jgi:hypothetical protein